MRVCFVAAATWCALCGMPAAAQEIPSVDVEVDDTVVTGTSDVSLVFLNGFVSYPLTDSLRILGLAAYAPESQIGLGVLDLTFTFLDYFGVGTTYLFLFRLGGAEEHSIRGHFDLRYSVKRIKFDLRNAVDYRFSSDKVRDRLLYRARARMTYYHPDPRFGAYVYGEPFYNFTSSELTRVNISGGIFAQVRSFVWVNFIYLRIQTFTSSPDINLYTSGIVFLFE
ncbi:MAG: DUF2490 domain-containing protein [Myxococcota bacterium]